MKNSAFYGYLTRLRWIKRWGLMRNASPENVMEHSWEVATIAHLLALIKNRYFNGQIDANAVATAALYHDVTEVLTGDLPTPIKYHSKVIQDAYQSIEHQAAVMLLNALPERLRPDFHALLHSDYQSADHCTVIKAADKISAYLKCQTELQAGNQEFNSASDQLLKTIRHCNLPEVDYFMEHFVPACGLTLDCLVSTETNLN